MPFFLCLLLSLLSLPLSANTGTLDALQYVNQLRQQAGMIALSDNKNLHIAAKNHADYLHRHRLRGHYEQSGKAGFTGNSHVERILYAGYPSRHADENASFHTSHATDKESVDGLMAAIYHRLAFLSFDYDEIGTGITKDNAYSSFVYNMGNTQKRKLCADNSQARPSGRYVTGTCADTRQPIAASLFTAALTNTQKNNPEAVLWPAANSTDIPPAFYEEEPDPLPNHNISGYPVSVQFNPAVYPLTPPRLSQFEIIDTQTQEKLELIAHLNQKNDPNHKLTAYEHVIFPLKRLGWDNRYQVNLAYHVNGQRYQQSWQFQTRKLPVPIITLTADNQTFQAKSGQAFAVYIPPRSAHDGKSRYSTRFYRQQNVHIEFIDDHTLLITPKNFSGQTTVEFHGWRFKIQT